MSVKKATTFTYDFGLLSSNCNPYLLDDLGSPVRFGYEVMGYDEFGNNLHQHTSSQPFSYTGYQYDSVAGNYFAQARQYDSQFGRFISEDVIKGNGFYPFTMNQYSYCWNKPLNWVDPNGMEPTDWEAAHMARNVYDPDCEDRPLVGGWEYYETIADEPGLRMIAYVREVNGIREYTVANMGTSGGQDWIENALQPIGKSNAMTKSIALAEEFSDERPGISVSFTGHSKGGAETVANGVATNRPTFAFNPATVNLSAYGLSTDNHTGGIRVFIIDGEVLDVGLSAVFMRGNPVDELITLSSPNRSWWHIIIPARGVIRSFQDHGMNAVIEAMMLDGFNDERCLNE